MRCLLLVLGLLAIPAVAQTPFGDQKLFYGYSHTEITIRDYIAIQAMTGLLAKRPWCNNMAKLTYQIADAMLEARESNKEIEIK